MHVLKIHKKSLGLIALYGLITVSSILISLTSNAYAHGVNVFAYVEGGIIYTESYFTDGKRVINGKIYVYDSEGNIVNTGRTNRNGEYSFKITRVDDLTVVLDATMGHRAELKISRDELEKEESMISMGNITLENESSGVKDDNMENLSSEIKDISVEDIKNILGELLDDRLKPINRKIAKLEKKNGINFTDIFGGIGYIFGLMGLVMFFRYRGK